MPLRLGAMLSGGGRTLLNLLDQIEKGALNAEIGAVLASRPGAKGIGRCQERGLDVEVVTRTDFATEAAMHDRITEALVDEAGVDLVCLCGYLRWMRVDPPLVGRVVNIHPSLLPAFGGKGMHGMNVHRAVLAAGRAFSGCTVHLVDSEYDHGPIILQRACPVLQNDDPETLAKRVFAEECKAYPEAIRRFSQGDVSVREDRVVWEETT